MLLQRQQQQRTYKNRLWRYDMRRKTNSTKKDPNIGGASAGAGPAGTSSTCLSRNGACIHIYRWKWPGVATASRWSHSLTEGGCRSHRPRTISSCTSNESERYPQGFEGGEMARQRRQRLYPQRKRVVDVVSFSFLPNPLIRPMNISAQLSPLHQ